MVSCSGMAARLRSFLVGRVRKAYDTLMRYAPSYRNLKAKLMSFVKSISVCNEKKALREFNTLRMKSGHSVLLHCLQLEQLAVRADFQSVVPIEFLLWQQISDTVAEEFRREMTTAIELYPRDEQRLRGSWDQLLALAGEYDRSHWGAVDGADLQSFSDDSSSTDESVASDDTLSSIATVESRSFWRRSGRRARTIWATRFHRR